MGKFLKKNCDGKTDQSLYTNRTKYIRLTTTFHLTLMMTSAQVVETSVTTTDNSPSQDYTHPDDQTTLLQANLLLSTELITQIGHRTEFHS